RIIGMFVNTLAMRNYPAAGKSFNGFLREVKQRTLNAFENQEYPFEELVEKVSVKRDTGRNPLFDVMFTLQNIDTPAADPADSPLMTSVEEYSVSKFDLTLTARDSSDSLFFMLEYCKRLFLEETIGRFINYFKRIVSFLAANPDAALKESEILSEEEKAQLLVGFNDTKAEFPEDKSLHRLFGEQVEKTPETIASVNRQDIHHVSYRVLNERAGQMADGLIERGVKPDDIVAMLMDRSIDMIIGILAILKAGGAYLPIDPGYPGDRINYILTDSNAKIVLRGDLKNVRADSQFKSPLERALEGPRRGAPKGWGVSTFAHSPANLAYIIYTSGSTGKPKGVAVEHRSVVNLLFSLFQAYPLGELDAYLMKTSFIFDVSVSELYGWFLGGGRLVIPGKDDHKDPRKIMAVVERTRVTHINFVPSMFNVFLEQLTSGIIGKLWSLKYIFLAGEALLPEQVRQFRELNSGIVLENIYGPTEATVYAAWYSLADWNGVGSVPIGKPLPNVRLYILDKRGCVQPVGVPGELCISGAGLARGYLNRPELTVDAFNKSYKSYRTYKTGDLARWWADGNIEFLGRIDHQVKIRGFRIELGEIESRLLSHEKIKEAVVIDRDRAGEKYLCAYIVGEIGDGGDVELLREYLGRTLPDYMIPALFIPLSEIPLTPSGKVDRKALPEPGSSGMQTGSDYISPRNDMEKRIAAIWQEVLGMEQIGIHDKFFNIGGNSLNVIRMNARLNRELGLSIPVVTMFRFPTINTLTRYLNPGEEPVETAVKPVEPDRSAKVSEGKSRRLQKLQKKRSSRI
ncbi:MAG: amino acid adenylation domain-containing protein, partial [bacterium]|nr:amino acid adenylation domain-containing protein [bacterium]